MKRTAKPTVSYEAWLDQQFVGVEDEYETITGCRPPAAVNHPESRQAPHAPTPADFRAMVDELTNQAQTAMDFHGRTVFPRQQAERTSLAREVLKSLMQLLRALQRLADVDEDDD